MVDPAQQHEAAALGGLEVVGPELLSVTRALESAARPLAPRKPLGTAAPATRCSVGSATRYQLSTPLWQRS